MSVMLLTSQGTKLMDSSLVIVAMMSMEEQGSMYSPGDQKPGICLKVPEKMGQLSLVSFSAAASYT